MRINIHDVFQNDLDIERFTALLAEAFGTTDYDTHVQKRGLRYPSENI